MTKTVDHKQNKLEMRDDYLEINARYYPDSLSPGQRDVLQTLLDAFIRLGDPKSMLIDDKRRDAMTTPQEQVCSEILEIMVTYHEQDEEGNIDTPGGLEHMGDVWRLLGKWERLLLGGNQ